MTWRRGLIALAIAAAAGIGIFVVMAWNATTTETMSADLAAARFAEARRETGDVALLERREDGTLGRRAVTPPARPDAIAQLVVMAYDAARERLIEVEIPFWFFRLKAPAAQFMVEGTGLDLETLAVSADDLAAQGPALLVDESSGAGNRLLIWTR